MTAEEQKQQENELAILNRLDLIHRRHHIYNGIAGKELRLLSAMPPGRTDCDSYIAIPMEDEESGLIHQHEWQHIFFKSDLRARKLFVDEYLKRIESTTPNVFRPPLSHGDPRPLWGEVENFLFHFINCLDDLRVCSLWEDPYPQSAEDIQLRWKRILIGSKRYQQDITMYMMALGLGLKHGVDGQLGPSEWKRYEKILIDGTEKVKKVAFPACLIAARWILDSIFEDVIALHQAGAESFRIGPPEPAMRLTPRPDISPRYSAPALKNYIEGKPPMDAAHTAPVSTTINAFMKGHAATNRTSNRMSSIHMMDTDVPPPSGPDPNYSYTRRVVDAAMGVSTQPQVQSMLEDAQQEIEQIIQSLSGRTKQLTPDEKMLQGLGDRVEFHDVEPQDVDVLELEPEDKRAVQVLHQQFSRLHGRKKSRMADEGELDPRAYIDLMMGSGGPDVFRSETTSKGFNSLVLIDMSGSMKSDWLIVARACKVLAEAMNFPFSKLEVWGFTSNSDGVAHIFRFKDVRRGYSGAKLESQVWGMTPLHLATSVSVRRMVAASGSSKHLVIISDGIPMHITHHGFTPNVEDLIFSMAAYVEEGRRKKVHTSGLVIGSGVPDDVADVMFGHRKYWSRVKDGQGELFHSLVTLVKDAFVQYLRAS